MHCLVWSDWASQPKVELANGIRLDTNYYYWPGSWIQNRPGFMTGSGMPMRFADTDGTMIDIYQAATQMTDESDQTYPFTPNTLAGQRPRPPGYYGAFTANMHTDAPTIPQNDALIASAKARGVPMVTGKQMLTWLDGRNGSTYGSINWNANTLSFTCRRGSGGQRSDRDAAHGWPEWHPADRDHSGGTPVTSPRAPSRALSTPRSRRPAAATRRRTAPRRR